MIPKFRGRSTVEDDKGKWVYGNLVFDGKRAIIVNGIDEATDEYIAFKDFCSVDIDTVGQSTGLKDKNGVEIFEGDIIATNSFACIVSFGKYDYFEDDGIKITGIGFYLGYLNVEPATYSPFETPFLENCEVLGNIYENELDLIMYEKWKSENSELVEDNA
ncbi:YopX family protein [Streptococcus intermedius]